MPAAGPLPTEPMTDWAKMMAEGDEAMVLENSGPFVQYLDEYTSTEVHPGRGSRPGGSSVEEKAAEGGGAPMEACNEGEHLSEL